MSYSTADFNYDAPAELIAQRPLEDRSASRLMVLHREGGRIEHRRFREFPELLRSIDVLVINSSRVIRARLYGRRENGREAEVLLVHPDREGTWLAMVHPGGKLKSGRTISFGTDATLEVVGVLGGGLRRVRLTGSLTWDTLMAKYGSVPLPPYIRRPADSADIDRYQTVFAMLDGSVAAPTAGLHFTQDILNTIRSRGTRVAEVVLHVGPGTFKPVQESDPAKHVMHGEWYSIASQSADLINEVKEEGGRVWAVGSTVTRLLETAGAGGHLKPAEGWTELFVRPPYRFRIVDALLTNFHLPQSTLLMLVCAFGGFEQVMAAYREAVSCRYRLYSYGDAMAVL